MNMASISPVARRRPQETYTPDNYLAADKTGPKPSDDSVHVHWDGIWRFSTEYELRELIYQCE
jgi:hypothetical protein